MLGPAIRARAATVVTVGLVAAVIWPQAPMWSTSGAELVTLAAPQPKPVLWTFDGDPVGGLPGGARVFSGQWSVRREADAPSPPNALCQTAVARFPAILLTPTRYANVAVEARFKTISGGGDQAAGIIFRVRDPDNYYVLRANALEDNVILFRYENGTRFGIAGADVAVPKRKWQTLRVEAVASRIRGFLNGKRVLETTDTAFNAGGIGLWTKADSETCFDEVRVTVP